MRILDLFCGAGGAAMGYNRAGFDVVGVDIEPQPRYPFEFVQADAMEFLRGGVEGFDAIHASPPCQRHSSLIRGKLNDRIDEYPDLIKDVRNLLVARGLPYVIENVPSASLIDPITLCGEMFSLKVIRHRVFESNVKLEPLIHIPHRGGVRGRNHGRTNTSGPYLAIYGHGGGKGSLEDWRDAMDVWWMETRPEMAQAIPPAYTEYVGSQLMKFLSGGSSGVISPPSRRAEAYCSQCGRRTRPDLANSEVS